MNAQDVAVPESVGPELAAATAIRNYVERGMRLSEIVTKYPDLICGLDQYFREEKEEVIGAVGGVIDALAKGLAPKEEEPRPELIDTPP